MAGTEEGERPGSDERAVLALENDLFFAVKITDILKHGGFQTRVARNASDFARLLNDGGYMVTVVNASARGVDWQACVSAARAAGLPVVAYASHVDVATQAAARVAGATRVIANSRLAELVAIVERALARSQTSSDVSADDYDDDNGDARRGAGDAGADS